ncbi:MAG: HD domain-containing protein, partial [Nitrospirota bacterium]|nr:HD domain-containing protein [Nitrospirota bacterium]
MNTRNTSLPDFITATQNDASCHFPSLSKALHILIQVMRAKEPTLLEHGRRTAHYATALGHAVGISARELIDLHYAALLHDIGKLLLSDGTLQKDSPLTHEEYAFVQCHPRDGARLLETIPALRRAAVLVAHHHEHWDGSGYPYGLRGTFIPLGSRILAVADRFDALCSEKNDAHIDER